MPAACAAFVDPRDHRADRDRVAFLDQLLGEHAGDRRRHLDRDLVGLEAGDRLVGGDRVAGLLQPLGERAFGDRFAERGNLNVSGHDDSFIRAGAGASSRLAAMPERAGDQGRLLGRVALGEAGGRRGGGVAAGIVRPHAA